MATTIAPDSAEQLHNLIGDDATATFENDPKFMNDGGVTASSANVAVQRDEDDVEDSDEEVEDDDDVDEEDEDDDDEEDADDEEDDGDDDDGDDDDGEEPATQDDESDVKADRAVNAALRM